MSSLYRGFPIGSLLVWSTRSGAAATRGDSPSDQGVVKLLLDGQQRITSLYGIVRGRPPRFFDGNANAFTGLHFNLDDETFEFYSPAKMRDNGVWIDVTRLMQEGVGSIIQPFMTNSAYAEKSKLYLDRVNAVCQIPKRDLHVEEVTGEDKTVDVVVEIFNRVNSGGTKLSKGDLALAKICADWPEARQEMRSRIREWHEAGYVFKLDWLLRNMNAVVTGQALFSALRDVTPRELQDGLKKAEKAIDYLLNLIAGRLGLDHDAVLGGRYAFPVMSRYVVLLGGKLVDSREQDRLLYWYIHSMLWGRYTGASETILAQDLRAISEDGDGRDRPAPDALERLIENLRRVRVDLQVRPEDFDAWSLGARVYPMLYLLTRVYGARDWGTGQVLSAHLLGKSSALNLHHIFPKARLYEHGYTRPEVNAVANFCFQTLGTNAAIGAREPSDYFPEVERRYPGALASQWVPTDPELWRMENYREFLKARRELLAEAANRFLEELLEGRPEGAATHMAGRAVEAGQEAQESRGPEMEVSPGDRQAAIPPGPRVDEVGELLAWVSKRGLPQPELHFEVCDPRSGEPLTIVDMAWPSGVQEGLSEPVALLLEPDKAAERALNRVGYRYFDTVAGLRDYLERLWDDQQAAS